MRRPRMSAHLAAPARRMRSTPSKRTSPVAETPGGNSRAIALAVSDLPDPDSPTMAIGLAAARRRDRSRS